MQRHEQHRLFAVDRVGPADDGGLGDLGQLVNDASISRGIDVLAAADDHVLGAVDQDEIAVLVEPTDVTGVQPAVDDGLGGLLGPVQIAAHHVGALDHNLAGLAVGHRMPVVSTMRIVWPGTGSPTVPGLRSPSNGLTVLAQDPSDNPYPSMIGMR